MLLSLLPLSSDELGEAVMTLHALGPLHKGPSRPEWALSLQDGLHHSWVGTGARRAHYLSGLTGPINPHTLVSCWLLRRPPTSAPCRPTTRESCCQNGPLGLRYPLPSLSWAQSSQGSGVLKGGGCREGKASPLAKQLKAQASEEAAAYHRPSSLLHPCCLFLRDP